MDLPSATQLFAKVRADLDRLFGEPLFDEWAVVRIADGRATVLDYHGPREPVFQEHLREDVRALQKESLDRTYSPGDFEFSMQAEAAQHDGFLMLGPGCYLLLNHTRKSMEELVRNPRWISVQPRFVAMAERFRTDPLRPGD